MSSFKGHFTRIKGGISTARRLPRLGKIRLGIKQLSKNSGREYPVDVSYFVVPPEVERVTGPQPTELDIMFPLDDEEIVFPQQLERYGSGRGLKCHGDGEAARERKENGEWIERACPCPHLKSDTNPKGECVPRGHLMVLLPRVSMGGVYQIDTSSFHSFVDSNSGIDYVRAQLGRIALVPLKLRRVPRDTHNDGKKQVHYPMQIILDADLDNVIAMRQDNTRILAHASYQIEGPVLEGPAADPPDVVVEMADGEVIEPPTPAPKSPPATPEPPTPPVPPAPPAVRPTVPHTPSHTVSGTIGTYQPLTNRQPGAITIDDGTCEFKVFFLDPTFVEDIKSNRLVTAEWAFRTIKGKQVAILCAPLVYPSALPSKEGQ